MRKPHLHHRATEPLILRRYNPPANMSCETAAVIATAFEFAAALRAKQVSITHLWAALASGPCTGRSLWFGTLLNPDDRAEARVRRRLLRQWGISNLRRIRVQMRPRVPLAFGTCRVLERAAAEARELNHPDIGTEHLVLALMQAKREGLFRDAETYSVAYFAVRRELQLQRAQQAARRRAGDGRSPANRALEIPKSLCRSRTAVTACPRKCPRPTTPAAGNSRAAARTRGNPRPIPKSLNS